MESTKKTALHLVVLYGVGGLSDVGRHAILAGLERSKDEVSHITVITKHPELLKEENWNCGCENQPHTFSAEDEERITIVTIDKDKSWNDCDLSSYLTKSKDGTMLTTTIISCIGNRQPFIGHWDSADGNGALLRAIDSVRKENSNSTAPFRVVILTACGINEDWPAFEFFWLGRVATAVIFMMLARKMYFDLKAMELLYQKSSPNTVDYLLVRPVGISEDVIPINSWMLQKEKYKHPLGFEMAKLDVARYMVEEALVPTRSRSSVVIGADPAVQPKRLVNKTTQSD
jgi:hypothetical protein